MKRRLLPLILPFALLLAACQPTPEAELVVQKNTEQMIEAALATPAPDAVQTPRTKPGKSALYAALGIPETYEATLTSTVGKLTVYIDVVPEAPDAAALPVARVVPANFSQELVTALYDFLIGDTPMYEPATESDKIMIRESILEYQQLLSNPLHSESYDCYRESIQKLTDAYEAAPDKLTPVPADGTLKSRRVSLKETDVLDGVNTYVNVVSDIYGGGASFYVNNNTEYENEGSYFYVDEEGNTQMFNQQSCARLEYERNDKERALWPGSGNVRLDVTELSLAGGVPEKTLLTITPAAARAQAQALLDAAGAGYMTIASVTLMSSLWDDLPMWQAAMFDSEQEWIEAGSPNPYGEERQGYCVTCLRSLNGVRVASDIEQTNLDGTLNSATWYNERLFIGVDDEGITGVTWIAPLKVTEVVTENAAVKPFSEIREIVEKMMFIMYEPNAEKYTITAIRLSLQRVSEQDSFESGLLAPVWNVYGYETYFRESAGEWVDMPVNNWPLLTVNAIDGSVIDLFKGY